MPWIKKAGVYSTHPEVILKYEKQFIDKLGKCSPAVSTARVELLRKYLRALEKRSVWEGVNPLEVKSYVRSALARYE